MNSDRDSLEVRVLRALCACVDLTTARATAHSLAGCSWSTPDHSVVFSAICGALDCGVAVTQENLIALATRGGFPDLELSKYFDAGGDVDLERTVDALISLRDPR